MNAAQHSITVGRWRYSHRFSLVEHHCGIVVDLSTVTERVHLLERIERVANNGRFKAEELGQFVRLLFEIYRAP